MPLVQTSAPGTEPLALADVKNALRMDSDLTQDDSFLLPLLISAARRHAESITGRSLITQGWRLSMDAFPNPGDVSMTCLPFSLPGNAILLERGTVQAVSAITYRDMSGTWQTMDPATYVMDPGTGWGRITPTFGSVWPIPLPQIGSVRVDYTAGYGDAAINVPEGIRHWMLVRVVTAYNHQDQMEQAKRGKLEAIPFIDGLLDPYVIPGI